VGFLDDLGPKYKPLPVPVEGSVGAWTAARTAGGLALTGGQVVLGLDWLVFSPWDMDGTRAWLVKWLGKAGVPHLGELDKLLSATKLLEPIAIPTGALSSAQVLSRGSLLKPPQVRLMFQDGRHFDLGILASPTTMNPSPKNRAALDDFLSKLRVPVVG
jgi:hypothetical protein